jgi:hypothetical protein
MIEKKDWSRDYVSTECKHYGITLGNAELRLEKMELTTFISSEQWNVKKRKRNRNKLCLSRSVFQS